MFVPKKEGISLFDFSRLSRDKPKCLTEPDFGLCSGGPSVMRNAHWRRCHRVIAGSTSMERVMNFVRHCWVETHPEFWVTHISVHPWTKAPPFPRRSSLPLSRRPLSHHQPTPLFSCIHSCNLVAAMDSGVKIGETLGPIVLAVVINVSSSPSFNPTTLTPP